MPFIGRSEIVNAIVFDARGNLWATEGSYGSGAVDDIVEFSATSLAAATTLAPPTPTLTISLTALPLGITFDARGNLWVVVGNDIDEYSGTPASSTALPVVQLTGAGNATALAFAPDGTLWYSRGGPGVLNGSGVETETSFGPGFAPLFNIYALTASQIAHSGSPAPASTLTIPGPFPIAAGQTDINVSTDIEPFSFAFDAAGDLWAQSYSNEPCVSNQGSCGTTSDVGGTRTELFEFAATTLHSTGAYTSWISGAQNQNPGGATIVTNSSSLGGTAFDTSGNLYELTLINNPNTSNFMLQIYRPQAFASASPSPVQSLPIFAGYITTGPTYR